MTYISYFSVDARDMKNIFLLLLATMPIKLGLLFKSLNYSWPDQIKKYSSGINYYVKAITE